MENEYANKLKEIYEGWKNLIFEDPKIEKIAKARAEICASCEFNIKNKCTECGCPLIAKTRSLKSKCPQDRWE